MKSRVRFQGWAMCYSFFPINNFSVTPRSLDLGPIESNKFAPYYIERRFRRSMYGLAKFNLVVNYSIIIIISSRISLTPKIIHSLPTDPNNKLHYHGWFTLIIISEGCQYWDVLFCTQNYDIANLI